MKNILIIEDDRTLSNGIKISLGTDNYNITQKFVLNDCYEYLEQNKFDLIILDINLPDGNGLDFLQKFRLKSNTPVILLTANDLEIDIVTGLELGANDYITKPFSLAILRARVNNQLRNINIQADIILDSFKFNFSSMEFYKNDVKINFSKTEQKLLKILIDNINITLTREILMDSLWFEESDFVEQNSLSVLIKRLRDKIEDNPSKPIYIQTVYGIGYTWRKSI